MKRLAQILTLSIFFAIAGQQISVAQMFGGMDVDKELAKAKKEGVRLDSINADKKKQGARLEKEIAKQEKEIAKQEKEIAKQEKEIAEQEKEIAEQEKELARLKAKKK